LYYISSENDDTGERPINEYFEVKEERQGSLLLDQRGVVDLELEYGLAEIDIDIPDLLFFSPLSCFRGIGTSFFGKFRLKTTFTH
jgi:hypothetical protein